LNKDEVNAIKEWMPSLKKKINNSSFKGGTLAERKAKQAKERANASKAAAAAKKSSDPTVANKRKANEISSPDEDEDNLDHVLGSAAEVERVWSLARYVLTSQRSQMAPVLFEAIMFLKFNRELWDEKTVQLAYDLFKKDKHDERAKAKVSELAQWEEYMKDDAMEEREHEEGGV